MASLMKMHHVGIPEHKVPARPIKSILNMQLEGDVTPFKAFDKALMGKFSPTEIKVGLHAVGNNIKEMEKQIFGDTSLLDSNSSFIQALKGKDEPLVDEEILKNNIEVRDGS